MAVEMEGTMGSNRIELHDRDSTAFDEQRPNGIR